MKRLREILTSWKFWTLLGLTVIIAGSLYVLIDHQNQVNAVIASKVVKQPYGVAEPETHVPKGVEQPITVSKHDSGVEYHTQAPTPVPTPTPIPIEASTPKPAVKLPPLILCDLQATPTPKPSPTPKPTYEEQGWLPRGVYIPVMLQGELDSSHMTTPVGFIVTKNIYQRDYGISHLIIPAGSRINGFASPGYDRDRIEIKGSLSLVFVNDGTEVDFTGIVCTQEYDPGTQRYGLYEKSSGLKGKFIQTNHFVVLQNLMGAIMTAGLNSAGQAPATVLQGANQNNVLSYQAPPLAPILAPFVQNVINPNQQSDTLMVQVLAGKTGYVYNTSVIKPAERSVGASIQKAENERPLEAIDPTVQQFKQMLDVARHDIPPQPQTQPNEQHNTIIDPDASLK